MSGHGGKRLEKALVGSGGTTSPSPEPEDLSKVEFTPSEVDALDALPPPTPSPGSPRHHPPTLRWEYVYLKQPTPSMEGILRPVGLVRLPRPASAAATDIAGGNEEEDQLLDGDQNDSTDASPDPKTNRGRPKGSNATPAPKLAQGEASRPSGLRRSSRIRNKSRQDDAAATKPATTKTTRSHRVAATTAKKARASSTAEVDPVAPVPKKNGREQNITAPKVNKPQGVVKRRGRPGGKGTK